MPQGGGAEARPGAEARGARRAGGARRGGGDARGARRACPGPRERLQAIPLELTPTMEVLHEQNPTKDRRGS